MDFSVIFGAVVGALFIYMIVDRICNAAEYIADAKAMVLSGKKTRLEALLGDNAKTMAFKIDKNGKSTPCDFDGNPIDSQSTPDVPPEVLGAVADRFRMMKAQKEDEIERKQFAEEESSNDE